jgi:hypothetical protein
MSQADPIKEALDLPSGARFYRCALQVNPFEYLAQNKRSTPYKDEASYNAAIIEACERNGIEVIAVTDHYRVGSAVGLWTTAREAGLRVFPGFEAATKDGVHLLCLFDPGRPIGELERVIGDCGVHDEKTGSPTGKYDVTEMVAESRKWGSVCAAAHVASDKGLLATLKGQARIQAWQSPDLLACALPGPVSDAPAGVRAILENKLPEYKRARPVAILNAQDVYGPDDLDKAGASCWIKMSEVSVEGLRQAFLDPPSRIRLTSDPMPGDHAEFVAIAWEGGFLDGVGIHFNENLNVLIGGRGAGKSTVIESLRCVLGLSPLGDEARKAHEGLVRQVLRNGTKISLLVRSYRPAKRQYRIERTLPNPPIVRDETGQVLNLTPADVIPQVEVYGQHEISELSRSQEKLTRLLERFVGRDPNLIRRKSDVARGLERSRGRIVEARAEIKQIEERLAALPGLEETLKRFQDAGVEDRLREQSLLVREERVLRTIEERVTPFRSLLEQLRRMLPIDRNFLSSKALEDLPAKTILGGADAVIQQLERDLEAIAGQLARALERADEGVAGVRGLWEERRNAVRAAYEKILRELQKVKVDGEEFIRLRQQIEELRPLGERLDALRRNIGELEEGRRQLLAEWEDAKAEEFRQLDRAAARVSRQLADRVRVQVAAAGNRDPLVAYLNQQFSGRLAEAIKALRSRPTLSLRELAGALRAGRDTLAAQFGMPTAQADRLAQAPAEVAMQIEELDLLPTTRIELNVAGEGQSPTWQTLDDLSAGQKGTAILLLLLLEADAPLIVDQPEDDLDNRFITEGVVPKMREEKRRRQFVFATHNANIPVLGDAELIVGLRASGEANVSRGRAEIPIEHMGSIDTRSVRELVEEILEGGREAFEMRRLKYGF